jgi:small-conductance mechanosensitive channel
MPRSSEYIFQIDAAFENIFNIIFYGVMAVAVLSQLGFDPLAMFLSISGVILAFAFSTYSAFGDDVDVIRQDAPHCSHFNLR